MSDALDQYPLRSLIRARSGHQLLAARAPDGAPCAVLLADDGVSCEALAEIARAHLRVRSPHVPRVLHFHPSPPSFLVFESTAVMDLESLHPLLRAAPTPMPYAAGIAVNELLMDTVEAAHEAGELLSALSWANVLIGSDGRIQLVGFGANLQSQALDGSYLGAPGQVVAPEAALGQPPTKAADVFAVHGLVLGLLSLTEPPPVIRRALQEPVASPLRAALAQLSQSALAPLVEQRTPGIAQLRAGYRALRRMAPSIPLPDPAMLRETVAGLVGGRRAGAVAASGLWLDLRAREARLPGGARVSLARRVAPWRILLALTRRQLARPGGRLTVSDLQEAGWPGETLVHESARARVYVAVSTLRKLGLGELLESDEDGYGFDRDLEVWIDAEPAP